MLAERGLLGETPGGEVEFDMDALDTAVLRCVGLVLAALLRLLPLTTPCHIHRELQREVQVKLKRSAAPASKPASKGAAAPPPPPY